MSLWVMRVWYWRWAVKGAMVESNRNVGDTETLFLFTKSKPDCICIDRHFLEVLNSLVFELKRNPDKILSWCWSNLYLMINKIVILFLTICLLKKPDEVFIFDTQKNTHSIYNIFSSLYQTIGGRDEEFLNAILKSLLIYNSR